MNQLTSLQRAGIAFATAWLWGQTGLPGASDVAGFGYVGLPVGPTSDLDAYAQAVKAVKALGLRVHVSVHHDGQPNYEFWPYNQPYQLVAFNKLVGARIADLLGPLDTWEVTNEPITPPGGTWVDVKALYAPGGPLTRARDAVRAVGVKALMVCPLPGSQSPTEAYNVPTGELSLSVFAGWDAVGVHLYPVSTTAPSDANYGSNWARWLMYAATLANLVDLPWIATEYGNNTAYPNNSPTGPGVLYAIRSMIEAQGELGGCLGGICWQGRTYDPGSSIGGNVPALAAIVGQPRAPSAA